MQITKAKKGSDDYLIDWCDYVIGDLVREKTELFKAYNYFNGVRDHFQYENLEKNYGLDYHTVLYKLERLRIYHADYAQFKELFDKALIGFNGKIDYSRLDKSMCNFKSFSMMASIKILTILSFY